MDSYNLEIICAIPLLRVPWNRELSLKVEATPALAIGLIIYVILTRDLSSRGSQKTVILGGECLYAFPWILHSHRPGCRRPLVHVTTRIQFLRIHSAWLLLMAIRIDHFMMHHGNAIITDRYRGTLIFSLSSAWTSYDKITGITNANRVVSDHIVE